MADILVTARRADPYRDFRFRIKWDGRYVAGVTKVGALKRSTEVIELRDGGDLGASHKAPGRFVYEPITLERGITHDRDFEQWANAIMPTAGSGNTPTTYRKTIAIELLDDAGRVTRAYTVHRCWVSMYQALPDLDARGNGIAFEAITIQNEGWERDTSVIEPPVSVAWKPARVDAGLRLRELAMRLQPTASWDDIVLPAAQLDALKRLATHVSQREKVYAEWGFAEKQPGALGVTALFVGPRGTGKRLAAEAIAGALGLDLYRVDLSSVISKYIGETEKNLNQLFDAAAETDAVLLLDEADALLGKRTDVKDSHDRYANIEVAYLLQRMERVSGLAILATNVKLAPDDSFQRLNAIVEFPFPDAAQREAIWRKVFPAGTPLGDLDYRRLAKEKLTGAAIRRAALEAAFRAAESGQPVSMAHVLARLASKE